MGGIFRNAAGEDRYFHDDEISTAMQSGWAPRDEIAARTASGDVVAYTPEQLQTLQQQRVSAPLGDVSEAELASIAQARNLEDVHGGAGSTVLAGLEGGASALTFGGSDHLLNALGADTKQRAQANPYARAVGEIGTTIGTTILTGGLGGVAKGALGSGLKLTPLGALTSRTGKLAEAVGGVKGLMLAEGAEGLVSAGGGLISKLAIKDEELTAKAALLDLGLGAVIGVAGGAGAGGLMKLGGGLKSTAAKFKSGVDPEAPAAAAFDEALGDATKVYREADKHLGKTATISKIGDLPDAALANGYTARNSLQFIDDVAEGNLDHARAIGRGAREVSEVRAVRTKIDRLISPAGEGVGTGATKGRSELYGPENAYQTTADVPALRSALQEYYEKTIALGKRIGFDDSEAKILNGVSGKGGLQRAFDEVNAAVPEVDVAALNLARKAADEAGDLKLSSLVRMNHGDLVAKLAKHSEYHQRFTKVADTLKVPGMTDSLEQFSARATAQLEEMTGIPANQLDETYKQILRKTNQVPPEFKGPAADAYRAWVFHQAQRQGGEIAELVNKAAREAEELGENQAMFEAGGAAKRTFGASAVKSGVRRAAGYVGFLAGNAMGGPIVGAALSGSVSKAVGDGVRKGGFLASSTGKLLHGIGKAATITGKAARLAGVNVGTLVRNTSFGEDPPPKKETARQSFERISKEVTAAATNPGFQLRLNEQLGEVREVNWGVGDKMEAMVMDAIKFLADAIPKDPGVLQKWGLSTWKPTDAEVLEFNNKVAAVVNPMNSIERFMSGGGSPAEAEAIRQVHPEIFREFQSAFMDNLVTMRDKIPGSTRVRLGILFDAPVDSRLRPEFRTYMKEHWIARAEEQKPLDVNAGMSPEQPSPAQKLLG